MIIGSTSENTDFEKRVAITPEIVKKYKSIGLEINLTKDYASHLGITDEDYETEGAKILETDEEVISNSNAIIQMNILSDTKLNKLKKDQILICLKNKLIKQTFVNWYFLNFF